MLLNEIKMKSKEIFVDRKEEDAAVKKYQETKDKKILDQIYRHRIPSLKNWSHQHYYPGLIGGSVDDLYSELTIAFIKAVNTYKPNKGSFNSWLFTILLNRIKNIKNMRYAKKRTSEDYDGALNGMILSLDYVYNEQESGSDLHELIEDKKENNSMLLKETIGVLSENNPKIRKYLVDIGNGSSISSVIKNSKIKNGYLNLSSSKCSKLDKSEKPKIEKLIQEKLGKKDFSLIDYSVKNKRIYYTVEFKKTKESEILEKGIKDIRKNKDYYCEILDFNA